MQPCIWMRKIQKSGTFIECELTCNKCWLPQYIIWNHCNYLYTIHVTSILILHYSRTQFREKLHQKMSSKHYWLQCNTWYSSALCMHVFVINYNSQLKIVKKKLTWHNVQWKWLTGVAVHTSACNCGSIVWGCCTKFQRGNQATLVSVITNNFCSEPFSPGGWTHVAHSSFSKCFTSPEKSISLSSACEGDFLWKTSVSSRDTACQYQIYISEQIMQD